ncbi:MAG: BLUF domain-containing protein [Methylocystaceae bacterium]|nr:BLUF domain-containing protein [Methylocystaceae bacterium]
MSNMMQLIYVSAALKAFSDVELTNILETARKCNSEKGISGILVYRKGSFLQVLEGPQEFVDPLFVKIKKDPRHTNIRLLFQGEIVEKDFEEWSMGFVDTHKQARHLDGFLDYATEFQALTLDETRARQVLKGFSKGSWRQVVE